MTPRTYTDRDVRSWIIIMDESYQQLWKRSKYKVGYGRGNGEKIVSGVIIPYFGIHKDKKPPCANCKGYHLTHLPTGYLAMASKDLATLKTAGLVCLDKFGDALQFDVENPATQEFRQAFKSVLDSFGRKFHGGPSGPQPWIKGKS